MLLTLSFAAPCFAQSDEEPVLRGAITPEVQEEEAEAAEEAYSGTSVPDRYAADNEDDTSQNDYDSDSTDDISGDMGLVGPGDPSASLDTGLGDRGYTEDTEALGGLGDGPTPGRIGQRPTVSEADRLVREAARDAAGRFTGAPLPPGVPVAPGTVDPAADPYAPLGTRIGSFILYSEVLADITATDNVLATPTDPQSDWAPELQPDFRLDSDWTRHALSVNLNGDWSWYREFESQNTRNYQALIDGRLDVTRKTNLTLELEKSQVAEGRSQETLPDAGVFSSDLDEKHITAGANHRINRVGLALEGTVTDYDYSNIILIGENPDDPTNTLDRDYVEKDLGLRGSYEFNPDMTVFVDTELVKRDYKAQFSPGGNELGSEGYRVQAGLAFGLFGSITGEIAMGYGVQDPIDEDFTLVDGFLFNADVLWQITALTSLSLQASTNLDETTAIDAAGAFSRFYGATLSHELRRNVILGGFITYNTADYIGTDLTDESWREGLTAEYLFNRNLALIATYAHTDYSSTDALGDYKSNEVTVGLRLRK
ncbi:outer membrane beta-barrel protein [Methyloligella solikamskensis]|uniref:Outer membrane beta-barrel protein n=1 Tax=Methyloligella solikamskensis TaxID=1177756 RepID=A0ABW3J7K8_9HYPH